MYSPEIDRARAIVLEHGWNSTCYQILNRGFSRWFSPEGDAVVGYVTHGGYQVVGGAPVCAENRVREVTRLFERDADAEGFGVCYFCAEARLFGLLHADPGHAAVVLGGQPVWNPRRWPEILESHASLRAQLHRAQNKGIHVTEWRSSTAENHPALRRCLHEWLETRGLPPLHFLIEPETLSLLHDRRCFVAARDDEVVAFLIASPVPTRNGWLVEQLVRGRDAVNGTSELLLDAAFRALIEQGSDYVTLGLAPLAHHADSEQDDAALWLRGLLAWARAHGRRFYNFEGLETFKSKFWPDRWDPVYLIINEPRVRVRALRATAAAFASGAPEALFVQALARAVREELRRAFLRNRRQSSH